MYLDYASIRVRDILESLRFYGRGLGLLEIRRGRVGDDVHWILLEDQTSRQRLALHWYQPGSAPEVGRAARGLDRFAVRTTDVDGLARRLIENGAEPIGRVTGDRGADAYHVRDPNGIVIELLPESHEVAVPVPA